MKFDEDQAQVVGLATAGVNVFFTGVAGTGKSTVLTAVVDVLKATHEDGEVAVTASTGIAAIAVGGTTLHATMGCGAVTTADHFWRMWSPDVVRRLRRLKVLVIDEVSMVSAELFYALDEILRQIRDSPRPFGGLQLVVCGDFLQLPPVPNDPPIKTTDTFLNRGLAFQSPAWAAADFRCVVLRTVWRQRDKEFAGLLRDVRDGHESAALELQRRSAPGVHEGAVRIVTTNRTADRINLTRLENLSGNVIWGPAADRIFPRGQPGSAERAYNARTLAALDFFTECPAPLKSRLKVGAKVLLLKTTEPWNGLVNGTMGIVQRFVSRDAFLADKDGRINEDYRGVVRQWGRPKTLIPVVKWSTGKTAACGPQSFEVDMAGVGSCVRIQLPLKLAWAITVHRSQGMSLHAASVSLAKCFADGQAYVALSRCRTLEGLHISKLRAGCVRASAAAKEFYARAGRPVSPRAWEALQREHGTVVPRKVVITEHSVPPRCFKCGSDDHDGRDCALD